MKWHRVRAVARKESLHVLRDPRALGIGIVLPMFMLFLFGYALTLDVDNVPILVWDQAESVQSRDLVSRFEGSRYFTIVGRAETHRTIERALDDRSALMGLVIPPDLDRLMAAGRPVPVQLIVDGSDANTATLAIGYAEAIARAWSQSALVERRDRAGLPAPLPAAELRPRIWFNADMESRNFIVPGLVAVIMMIITALLTSLTVAREWETGTMEQLISTPLTPGEIIAGKLVPYFAIGFLDVVISVVMGRYVFGVPLRGSVPLLLVMSSVFLVGALSLGMLISIVTKNQLVASQLALVGTFLPAFLLSGFMFEIENMPPALQTVTYFIPARYFIRLLRGIYLKGVGVDVLRVEGVFLLGFGLLMLALARHNLRKKIG